MAYIDMVIKYIDYILEDIGIYIKHIVSTTQIRYTRGRKTSGKMKLS